MFFNFNFVHIIFFNGIYSNESMTDYFIVKIRYEMYFLNINNNTDICVNVCVFIYIFAMNKSLQKIENLRFNAVCTCTRSG